MSEPQLPEIPTPKNEPSTETPIPNPESEPTKSLDTLIAEVKQDLDRLTPFAIQVLNPFSSPRELAELSAQHWNGADKIVYFMEIGDGEDIQGEYIQAFIRKFFPRIEVRTINYLEYKEKRKFIKTKMMDFFEEFKKKSKEPTPKPRKRNIVFSMTPTKILHSNPANPEVVAQLKATLFREIEKICQSSGIPMQSFDAPLLVGDMAVLRAVTEEGHLSIVANIDTSELRKIGTSFRIISSIEREILCGFYDAETDTYIEEARIPTVQEKILRVLYTIGDFSIVRANKNKMEGVVAGTKVITTEGFTDVDQNPNVVLDNLLRSRGHIVTIDEAAQIGLQQLEKVPPLTEQSIRELYMEYMGSEERVAFEPDLKESMKRLIDRIVAPPENLLSLVRKIFG